MIKHILTFDSKTPTKKRILVSDEDFFLVKVENSDHTQSCVIDQDETSDFIQVGGDEYSTTYKFTPAKAGDVDLKVRLGNSTQLQELTITRQDLDIGHSDTTSTADVADQLEAVDAEINEVKKEMTNGLKSTWQKGGSYVQNSGSAIGNSKGNIAIDLDTATYYANSEGNMTIDGTYLTINSDVTFSDKVHISGGNANFDTLNALGGLAVGTGKTIKIGSTSLTEDQLKKLLALI